MPAVMISVIRFLQSIEIYPDVPFKRKNVFSREFYELILFFVHYTIADKEITIIS